MMAILDYILNENFHVPGDPDNGISSNTTYAFIYQTNSFSLQFAPQSKVFASCSILTESGQISQMNNKYLIKLYGEEDQLLFGLYCTTSGALAVNDYCYEDGVLVQTDLGLGVTTSYQRIDIEIEPSSDGAIRLYIEGALLYERTGNTQYMTENVNITEVVYSGATAISYYYTRFTEMFVCDGDTDSRGITMVAGSISGNGQDNNFIGDYTSVSELARDDKTYMTAQPNTQHSFSITPLDATYDTYDVVAVGVGIRCLSELNTNSQFRPMIRSASTTDQINGADAIQSFIVYAPVREVYNTAPDGTVWDRDKLTDTEIGVVVEPGE